MSILAASMYSGQGPQAMLKTVLVKRQKGGLTLTKAERLSLRDISNYKKAQQIMLTCDYDDYLTAEIDLPPLNDRKSINYLIKNKVIDLIRPDKEYTFVLHDAVAPEETNAPKTSGEDDSVIRKQYSVFGVPTDFAKEYGVGDSFNIRLTAITINEFALIRISEKMDGNGFVCHVFADERQLLIAFSIGKDLVYARNTPVPKDISTQEDLVNFYYETINLTALYIRQNKQQSLTTMIFSGLLVDELGLAESVEQFTELEVVYPDASRFIKNCDNKTFHEYLLPIACAMITDYSNFVAVADKESRIFKDILSKVTVGLVVVAVGTFGYCGVKYKQLASLQKETKSSVTKLERELSSLRSVVEKRDELTYNDNFIATLMLRDGSPLKLLVPSQPLLNRYKFSTVEYDTTMSGLGILKTQKTLPTYTSIYQYMIDYEAFIALLNAGPQLRAEVGQSILHLQQKELVIHANITKAEVEE